MDAYDAKKGWLVVAAGTGLNLALGVLYAWSVFAKQFTDPLDKGGFGWTKTESALPYTLAIAVFALMMIPAGRLQDRFGPRLVATCGAFLIGLGLFVAGFATADSMAPALFGFGLLGGAGIGLGYSSATPAAVKWFHSSRKGVITGIVVSGFGLAPVYIAPLSRALLNAYGLSGAFKILGVAFAVLAGLLCQLIVNPPLASKNAASGAGLAGDTWRDMVRTPTFYMLWLQYACAATAGLMIIGHLARIVSIQSAGASSVGYLFVALLAIFNASGRIAAGFFSDRFGRNLTIALVCLTQAVVLFVFGRISNDLGFFFGAALVGFNYGACLSLFPSKTADQWGTRNFGLNYGIMFTAWGVGGVFGPILAGRIADASGSYAAAYAIASGMLLFAAALSIGLAKWGLKRVTA
jgi:MFS family permease